MSMEGRMAKKGKPIDKGDVSGAHPEQEGGIIGRIETLKRKRRAEEARAHACEESVDQLRREFAKELGTLRDCFSDVQERITKIEQLGARLEKKQNSLAKDGPPASHSALEELRRKIDAGVPARGKISDLETHLATLEELVRTMGTRMRGIRHLSVLSPTDFSYFWFEDQHRGPADQVRESLRPFLLHFQRCRRVVDLGCGRGEFLDLCGSEGVGAYGVDSNEDMVLHCQRLGLEVTQADIIEHLYSLSEKSIDGIFCSQVIEHLPMHTLVSLLRESYRVLKRGTCLVLVTINPRSLFALANNFYLDPTHVRPLPPETIRFLAEDAGFRKLEVSYYAPFGEDYSLLPLPERAGDTVEEKIRVNFDRLNHVVFGYQEYAVIGLK